MVVDNKYNIGQTVYLKHDPEQLKRIVQSIQINPGNLSYCLGCGSVGSWHYEFEISEEVNILERVE